MCIYIFVLYTLVDNFAESFRGEFFMSRRAPVEFLWYPNNFSLNVGPSRTLQGVLAEGPAFPGSCNLQAIHEEIRNISTYNIVISV